MSESKDSATRDAARLATEMRDEWTGEGAGHDDTLGVYLTTARCALDEARSIHHGRMSRGEDPGLLEDVQVRTVAEAFKKLHERLEARTIRRVHGVYW